MTDSGEHTKAGEGPERPAPQTHEVYQIVVGLLLLLIISLLAVLWVQERSARMEAQYNQAAMQQRQENTEAVLRELITGDGTRSGEPIRREQLPTRTCRLDGDQREILLLDDEKARDLGFALGDLILVTSASAPSRTSAPAP